MNNSVTSSDKKTDTDANKHHNKYPRRFIVNLRATVPAGRPLTHQKQVGDSLKRRGRQSGTPRAPPSAGHNGQATTIYRQSQRYRTCRTPLDASKAGGRQPKTPRATVWNTEGPPFCGPQRPGRHCGTLKARIPVRAMTADWCP